MPNLFDAAKFMTQTFSPYWAQNAASQPHLADRLAQWLGWAPEFTHGGLPLLLFTLAAFCLLGFIMLARRPPEVHPNGGKRGGGGRGSVAVLSLLAGLAALMVAIALKIA